MRDNCHLNDAGGATLEDLMAAYRGADPAAATALVDRVSPQLYRYFCTQLGSRADAADMLQETWLRIHRVRDTYRPGSPLMAWVYAIAYRVRVDDYRLRRRRSREIGMESLPEVAQPDTTATGPNFEEMVASLPESQRSILILSKVDGFSVEEIARATRSTAGAVKQKAHRAYRKLREMLASDVPHCFRTEDSE